MTTICWTVIHHTAAPVAHQMVQGAQVARRVVAPVVRRAASVAHHAASVAAHPRVWIEVVCKVLPAAIALAPQPANPPAPPAIIQPAPPPAQVAPRAWRLPPTVAPVPYVGPPTASAIDDPSSGSLLLASAGGLVAIRLLGSLCVKREALGGKAPPPRS